MVRRKLKGLVMLQIQTLLPSDFPLAEEKSVLINPHGQECKVEIALQLFQLSNCTKQNKKLFQSNCITMLSKWQYVKYIHISLKTFPGGDKFSTGKTSYNNKIYKNVATTWQTKRRKRNIFHIKMHINNKWNQPNGQNRNPKPETKENRDARIGRTENWNWKLST